MARGVVSAARIMISDVPRLSVLVAGYSVSKWGEKSGGRIGVPNLRLRPFGAGGSGMLLHRSVSMCIGRPGYPITNVAPSPKFPASMLSRLQAMLLDRRRQYLR